MATRESNDKPRKTTRRRRAGTARTSRDQRSAPPPDEKGTVSSDAQALYHHEKARRAGVTRPKEHPLEQARRAYQALLASDAERAKGGRPRKVASPKPAAGSAGSDDEHDAED